jgi:peptidoglycan-associated lipoprotein
MMKLTNSAKLATLSCILLLAACSEDMPPPPPAVIAPPPPMAPPPPPPPPPPAPPRAMPPVVQQIVPGSLQDFQVNVGDRVFFEYDKSDLTDAGRSTLQKQAAWLQRFGAVTLAIEGHCDERGTREYNLALGARRAQAVKDYLGSLGVAGARLETISFGKERPVCVESNDACYQQNRRGVSTIKSGAVS